MIQFTHDASELPPVCSSLTIRMFLAGIALTSVALAVCLSSTFDQLAFTTIAGLTMAVPLAAVYGGTSRLSPTRRLFLSVAFWFSFSVFVMAVSFGIFTKIDLLLFNKSGEWSPMPPEILSVPLMLISAGIAILSGYMTLNLANVVERLPS